MPDNEKKLLPDEKNRALLWLQRKAPTMVCPACGHQHFTIADHLLNPPIYYGGGMVIGGPSYPQFIAVCQNCTHMMAFSAVASGVIAQAGKGEKDG